MAKKSWFSLLKNFFTGETQSKLDKEKRKRWAFRRGRVKRLTSVSALTLPNAKTITTEEEEQRSKYDVDVLNAKVVAAEVVSPKSAHEPEEETTKFHTVKVQMNGSRSPKQCEKGIEDIEDVAATKIQTAYRGYLARKALRALRGLVRLQAIIRGRAVRRQAVTTLKCLQSVVNIQSQICARRFQMAEETCKYEENKVLQEFKERLIKADTSGEKRWDDRILSKDDANAIFLSKKEATMRRERIKEYWLSHRRSAEPDQNKSNGKWRYWLEQWVDTQLSKNTDTMFPSNARMRENYQIETLGSPIPVTKRSAHHKKQRSFGDDNGLSSLPVVPTYMAATESAKAKAKSMSSPKLRGTSPETHSETNSPFKTKLSPSLRSLPAPVKSGRSSKDLSFDSESSIPYWGGNGVFR